MMARSRLFPLPDSCDSTQTHGLARCNVKVIAWQQQAPLWAVPGSRWLWNGSWYSVWQTERAQVRCEVDSHSATLVWSTAALLQPLREITALSFRILLQLNPNKDCSTSGVSGRGDKLHASLLSAFPAFSYLPKRALQAPPCSRIACALNTKCGLCNARELCFLTRVGLLAVKGVTPLGRLCSTACGCWATELVIERLALEELNLHPSKWH